MEMENSKRIYDFSLGVSLGIFPTEEIFSACALAGVRFIELSPRDGEYEMFFENAARIRKMAEDAGLTLRSLHLPFGTRINFCAPDPLDLSETMRMEKEMVHGAAALGVKYVIAHGGIPYPQTERKILDDFSLRLERGKHYAFVGVNGAGKTTMMKLITGLYDNYEGEILLNGRDIRTFPQSALKALCAVVFQDFARYQVSMRDSITLGDEARNQNLNEVLEQVGLTDAVNTLSKGLDTPLGKIYEGGQDLSGGQWQRLAIARALVRNSPIRILDEPTAALDPVSESEFYAHFGELSKGTTTIFISHRLGSTKLADRIFVLDGGKIVEEGTQAELLAKGGLYAEMYEAQRSWYE